MRHFASTCITAVVLLAVPAVRGAFPIPSFGSVVQYQRPTSPDPLRQVVHATDISPTVTSDVDYVPPGTHFKYSYRLTHLRSPHRHTIAQFAMSIPAGLLVENGTSPPEWICPGPPLSSGAYACGYLHDDGMLQGVTSGPISFETEALPGFGAVYVQSNQVYEPQPFSVEGLPPDQEARVMEQFSIENNSVHVPAIVPKIRLDDHVREHVVDELMALSTIPTFATWKKSLRDLAVKLAAGGQIGALIDTAKLLPASDSLSASVRKAIVVDFLYLSAHGN